MTSADAPSGLAQEHVFDIRIDFTDRWRWGPTPAGGDQLYTPASGGVITGPRLQGRVVPNSGADYATLRPDGVIALNAHYVLEASDGALIYIFNRGFVVPPPPGPDGVPRPFAEAYFRCVPTFTTAAGPHDWLTRTVIVGSGERRIDPDHSVFRYYALV